jgi:hypothetical protein
MRPKLVQVGSGLSDLRAVFKASAPATLLAPDLNHSLTLFVYISPVAYLFMAAERGRPLNRVRQRDHQILRQILTICPAAVAPVARALHIRMPFQVNEDRDSIEAASVRSLREFCVQAS